MARAIDFICKGQYARGIENNRFGYGYNPPGFEIAYTQQVYKSRTEKRALVAMLKAILFVAQLILLRICRKKVVWTAHNLKAHENIHPNIDRFCTGFIIRISDMIIAHCETAKKQIASLLNLKNTDKIVVIPHGNYVGCYENKTKKRRQENNWEYQNQRLFFYS